jgi:hypothetical protein
VNVFFGALTVVWFITAGAALTMFVLKAQRIVEKYKEAEDTDTLGALMDSPELAEWFIDALTPWHSDN